MTRALVMPKALPVKVRQMLRVQCDGDWDRVTQDHDGSYVVHNNALQAQRFVAAGGGSSNGRTPGLSPANGGSTPSPPAPPPAPRAKPRGLPPRKHKRPAAPRRPANAQLTALATLVGSQAPGFEPGVRVIPAPKPEAPEPEEKLVSVGVGEAPDWAQLDVGLAAYKLQERCRNGLPDSIAFEIKPDVLALYGMDMSLIESAVRNPERVEVRPETKGKKYPILGFYRGDIMAVVGMRLPNRPAIIAAYASSKLEPDTTPRAGGTGGGGAKKSSGLPGTVNAAIRQLRAHGAELPDEGPMFGDRTAEVKFRGQSLGQISLGDHVPKATVQSDYQRMLRKINGIKDRQGVAV